MQKSLIILLSFITLTAISQKKKVATPIPQNTDKQTVMSNIDKRFDEYAGISKQIWNYAELGYMEEKSSILLQDLLKKEGFNVTAGIAGIPTAFLATFGEGKPTIGILAEYDALPGLAQEAVPEIKSIPNQRGGHGCGHNLFGTASVAAAIEVKNWLKSSGQKGTVKIFGCPAEEGGSGKVYMVREGFFNDVDVVLHWHPGSQNSIDAGTSMANKNAKFRFKGIAAHASASPERGRSALDGVEAMDMMVNMMREHIPQDTRIHYVITKGGDAPNVVPAYAEVYYYARHKDREVLQSVWKRIENAAQGAALGTGTKVEWEVLGGVFNLLPNLTLAETMHQNLAMIRGVTYTEEEKIFAQKISETLGEQKQPIENAALVKDYKNGAEGLTSGASTDVGDVSWIVPTIGLQTATWVSGSAAHSWQSTAASGMTIGQKGMIVAAKTLACTALDLFKDQTIIDKAKAEFIQKRGVNFKYEALLGDRKPALDYRK